ncbi:MAG: SBBP repeat-containing protein [Bacteroidia bacterium]
MKRIYFIIFLFANTTTFGQAPNWQWAKKADGLYHDAGNSISSDVNGNIYVTGSFSSPSITFGTITLTGLASNNIFVVKYDATGNVIWAKSTGGNGGAVGYGIHADAFGIIYVTGGFGGSTIIFDSDTLVNTGISNFFIAKYNSAGNVVWAKNAGGTSGSIAAYGISADIFGNSYITGVFTSPFITIGSTVLTNSGQEDIFIAKYDFTGNAVWAKKADGNSYDFGQGISADITGYSYVTGYFFSDSIKFGNITLFNGGWWNFFTVKYDPSGNVLWAKTAGGLSGTEAVRAFGIDVDASGNTYVAGDFGGSGITFGSITLSTTPTTSSIFVLKYDTSGTEIWVKKSIGTTAANYAYGIIVDSNGNSYITGGFYGDSIIIGSTTLINNGYADVLIAKYDAMGNPIWAKNAGGTYWEYGSGIAVDANGSSYITGQFRSDSIYFDNITLINTADSVSDFFIAKLGNTTGTLEINTSFSEVSISPNPATNKITISNPQSAIEAIEIYNVMGQIVFLNCKL